MVSTAIALGTVGYAAAYVQCHEVSTRGGATFTGNVLGLSRNPGAPGLPSPGVPDSIGSFGTVNAALQVGTYLTRTTDDRHLNGATAVLTLAVGSSVLHAESAANSTGHRG
jgi:hypothetical protein